MLTLKKLQLFKEYLQSGEFIQDFENRPPDGQAEMLDMIDLLFEICSLADEIMSKHFYRKWGELVLNKENKE